MFSLAAPTTFTIQAKIPTINEEASFEDDFVRIIGSTPHGQGSLVEQPELKPQSPVSSPPKAEIEITSIDVAEDTDLNSDLN